jgi:hypothetical protein
MLDLRFERFAMNLEMIGGRGERWFEPKALTAARTMSRPNRVWPSLAAVSSTEMVAARRRRPSRGPVMAEGAGSDDRVVLDWFRDRSSPPRCVRPDPASAWDETATRSKADPIAGMLYTNAASDRAIVEAVAEVAKARGVSRFKISNPGIEAGMRTLPS